MLDGAQHDAVVNVVRGTCSTQFGCRPPTSTSTASWDHRRPVPGRGVDKAQLVADDRAGASRRCRPPSPRRPAARDPRKAKRARRAVPLPTQSSAQRGAQPWDEPGWHRPDRARRRGGGRGGGADVRGGRRRRRALSTREADEWAMLAAARHQPDQGRAVAQRLVQDAARARSRASSTRSATMPLTTDVPRVMLHAHGGLVGERSRAGTTRARPCRGGRTRASIRLLRLGDERVRGHQAALGMPRPRRRCRTGVRASPARPPPGRLGRHEGQRAAGVERRRRRGRGRRRVHLRRALAALVASKPPAARPSRCTPSATAPAPSSTPTACRCWSSKGCRSSRCRCWRRRCATISSLAPAAAGAPRRRSSAVLMCTMDRGSRARGRSHRAGGIPIYGKSLLYLISRRLRAEAQGRRSSAWTRRCRTTPRRWPSSTAAAAGWSSRRAAGKPPQPGLHRRTARLLRQRHADDAIGRSGRFAATGPNRPRRFPATTAARRGLADGDAHGSIRLAMAAAAGRPGVPASPAGRRWRRAAPGARSASASTAIPRAARRLRPRRADLGGRAARHSVST